MVDIQPEVIEVDEEGKEGFEYFSGTGDGIEGDECLVLEDGVEELLVMLVVLLVDSIGEFLSITIIIAVVVV